MQTRRQFFTRTGAAAAATVLSTNTPARAWADEDGKPTNPVFCELQRLGASSDARTLINLLADFYTDPAVIALPTYFLQTASSTLSSFQKDIFNTYLALVADPHFLKHFLTQSDRLNDKDRKSADKLTQVINSSASFLTLLSAAAELKTIPSLAPQFKTGVQQFASQLTTPLPPLTATGVPALDAVLVKFNAILQSTANQNFSKALYQIIQRSDFLAFASTLPPSALTGFIPFNTALALQLPIDAPDSAGIGTFIVYFVVGLGLLAGGLALGGTAGFGAFVALFTFGVGAMITVASASVIALLLKYGDNDNDGDPGDPGENTNGD
jgi:hypothetical protein